MHFELLPLSTYMKTYAPAILPLIPFAAYLPSS